ncbi:hypothetical protein ACXHMN_18715 [Rhizobium sp. LEGMi12c]
MTRSIKADGAILASSEADARSILKLAQIHDEAKEIAAMSSKSGPAAAEGVPTIMDLEPLICDLRNMAALTDRAFDDYLCHALAMKYLDRDEADELCYAYKHIFKMATDLRRAFYRTLEGGKGNIDT